MMELDRNLATRWAIRHETVYRYSVPVAFAPHVLRLTPRSDSVRIIARDLQIAPTPIEVTEFSDEFGNDCTRVIFGPAQAHELAIDSRLRVESLTRPVPAAAAKLSPLPWAITQREGHFAFHRIDGSAEVARLAQRVALEVEFAPLPFFERLNSTLYSMIDRQIRIEGHAQTPAETLNSGRGACRDLTVLYLAVCRSMGVAGRFVSGYQGQEASADGKRHLHAWPEVFVPELGWRGWDPTHGVAVGPGHVALSAAPEQAATMPVDGGFYFNGPTVSSTLGYSITFEPI